jgi:hypothetical protein
VTAQPQSAAHSPAANTPLPQSDVVNRIVRARNLLLWRAALRAIAHTLV